MNDQWITIRTYTYPEEAYVLRSFLEAEGIRVQLLNEFTVQSYNFLSVAVGGVELQVLKSDVDKVRELMSEGDFEIDQEHIESEAEIEETQGIQCMHCGSTEVKKQRNASVWGFVVGVFLLGIPFFFPDREYHCFDCGKNFKAD